MLINLKELAQQRLALNHLLTSDEIQVPKPKLIRNLLRFLEDVESDLEIGGESIVELDMSRLEAVEERNKMLQFLKDSE